ncbi:MAG: transglycosylase SLT domain-containing protein [Acetobacteraceae bacterium]|nr:transglycosylase SLT domain-containing protein [Acetobacteraceae bacterium]MCX7684256.1 transglycosylase SLT domain-containing protein [Acetobacteraceae bacterium]MDW8398530.1 transglycosylase SLT domain-containing protein [Acetobacteraceae bacterium]
MRALVLALLLHLPAAALAESGPIGLCRAAIAAAERAANIPAGLLHAIGRVESGRRDPDSGAFGPWPWTINAEGRGQFFPTREAAVAAVRQLQAQGIRSIDVGCMQVNLRHHPNAFASIEEAFDPVANARYAARFLTELHASRNDWLRAAAHYHSSTPAFAESYRARVEAAWPEERARALAMAAAPPRPQGAFAIATSAGGIRGADRTLPAPLLRGAGAPSGGGRDLSDYRATPIPLVGRLPVVLAGRR